jgi:hypothetical protein
MLTFTELVEALERDYGLSRARARRAAEVTRDIGESAEPCAGGYVVVRKTARGEYRLVPHLR